MDELETALRIERDLNITLSRYTPDPSIPNDKGDWICEGLKFDKCAPAPAKWFDADLKDGNFKKAFVVGHLDNPNVDFVVLDITGKGYSQAQVDALKLFVQDNTTAAQRSRIYYLGF